MQNPQIRKKCILFVENDPSIFRIVDRMLKLLGYEAIITSNSKEAFRLIQSQSKRFDLVITDMNMPEMGGLDLAKKVLEVRPDIPIVICTGLDALEIDKEARKAGIRAILPKPFLLHELKQTISKAMVEG